MAFHLTTISVVLMTVVLFAGLSAGYLVSYRLNGTTNNSITTTTTQTQIVSSTLATTILRSTTGISTMTSTVTQTALQTTTTTTTSSAQWGTYLNMSQVISLAFSQNVNPYIEIAGAVGGCFSSMNQTVIVPNATNYIYRMDLRNGSNVVKAAITPADDKYQVWLDLWNCARANEWFVFYVDDSVSPTIIYLYYYGSSQPPPIYSNIEVKR